VDSPLLVIGYGNTLRRDDGIGPVVAGEVEELRLPGVRTLACQLLTPELADPLSRAGTVVFVDAAVGHPGRVRMRRLDPSGSSQILAHAADPRTLLALARDAFGRAPEAWLLTVPAEDLGFGEQLSSAARRGLRKAVRAVQALHRRLSSRAPLSLKEECGRFPWTCRRSTRARRSRPACRAPGP
jgi:hydrogenase maturation protease